MGRVPGILWVAGGAALWGTDAVLRRPLAGALTPVQLVFYEHLILSVIALPILLRGRHYLRKLTAGQWAAVLVMGWVGSALATVLFTYAIQAGNPTAAVLLQKTQPLFAIALAGWVLGEVWPRMFLWLVGIALAGSYLVAFGGGNLLAPFDSLAFGPPLLAILAAAGWGISTVCGRVVATKIPFEMVTALRLLTALPALGLTMFLRAEFQLPAVEQIPPLLWLALVPGFAALMLYYRGLATTPASQATIAELAFPATAFLLNWAILGFGASPLQGIGFGIVWAVIFYLSTRPARLP